jgi:hypothetical protein
MLYTRVSAGAVGSRIVESRRVMAHGSTKMMRLLVATLPQY